MAQFTHFLPAERLSDSEVREQARALRRDHGLISAMDTCQEPMAVLNAQRQVVFCNDVCLRAAGVDGIDDAIGLRPGELLGCAHAKELPGGCGTSLDCRFCGLALAVLGGLSGQESGGECLLDRDKVLGATSEYRVKVQPQPVMGEGWVSCSMVDISHEKRRLALERIFFHDLMNRASAVRGISDALGEGGMPGQEREELTQMLSVSARALVHEIENQGLLLAAERGELAVKRAPANTLVVLREAAAACGAFGLDDEKTVEIDPTSDAMDFETDPTLLGRVLLNLLKNALEASTKGQTVRAGCRRQGPDVCFSVQNQSVMPPSVRSNVFRRSFSTKGTGRGLGTYSVRLLTEAYLEGRVEFESNPACGTVFRVLVGA